MKIVDTFEFDGEIDEIRRSLSVAGVAHVQVKPWTQEPGRGFADVDLSGEDPRYGLLRSEFDLFSGKKSFRRSVRYEKRDFARAGLFCLVATGTECGEVMVTRRGGCSFCGLGGIPEPPAMAEEPRLIRRKKLCSTVNGYTVIGPELSASISSISPRGLLLLPMSAQNTKATLNGYHLVWASSSIKLLEEDLVIAQTCDSGHPLFRIIQPLVCEYQTTGSAEDTAEAFVSSQGFGFIETAIQLVFVTRRIFHEMSNLRVRGLSFVPVFDPGTAPLVPSVPKGWM